jgi:hypothetical protein
MRSVLRAVLTSFLLLPNLAVLPSAAPARNDSSPRDWQRDLRILIEEIEAVHPDPWFHADRAAVIAATDELYERLPEMSWEESFAGFHRIVAMLRDGHTRVQSHRNPELDLRRAQIQYHLFPDGLRVIAVHPEHAEILGGRVVRIGNADVDEAWAKMEPLVPADNEWTVRGRTPRFLTFADLLVGLGILEGPGECPIEVEKDGRRIRTVVPSSVTHDEAAWPSVLEEADASLPLYLRYPERSYFFEHLPGKDAVYLHFRRVTDDEGESFEEFCDRAFEFLEEREIGRLVVDLRLNGGGNNFLNRPLIHGIIRNRRVNREGNLFVIVGRTTFSAAMCGTVDLERQTNAIFAGEPTGASPNHHGDAVPITLPHTGITISISALFWQNSDPRDHRPWLEPDLPVELTWKDYVDGRDPVLAAVLDYQGGERRSIAETMRGWIRESGVSTAIARYRALRSSAEQSQYDFGEFELNAVGYELLGEGRTDDALALFELNVEMHPHAYNPWDSLGEALAGAGHTAEAIEAYQRSVELNRASRSGQAALRRLRREASNGISGSE